MRSLKSIATVLFFAVLVCGCFGGGATVKTRTTTVSIGQQLIDLQKAYQAGSMTEDQYEKAKEQLIDRTLDN
jgi:PBP1b-binding outer membrane lipoprotein LpoB